MGFHSTYEFYKRGQLEVDIWLTKTATRYGYEGFVVADTSKQNKCSTKNSHEKKQKNPSKVQFQRRKYVVEVKEYPVIATFISERFQMSDLKVLSRILIVLGDVIYARKQCGKIFTLPNSSTSANNTGHRYIITVLEEVYQILVRILTTTHRRKEQSPLEPQDGQSMNKESLGGMFIFSDTEESSDRETTIMTAEAQTLTDLDMKQYELEDEFDKEGVYFKLFCFFEDFEELREQIRQNWADYMNGILDIVAVAVTTNVYLEILQRAEAELLTSLPKKFNLTNYAEMAGLLNLAVAVSRGVDPGLREEREDVINMELQDIADLTRLPIYSVLSSFLLLLEDQKFPVLKAGSTGKIDMTGRPLTWREKFNQDKIVLLQLLPDFCILEKLHIPIPIVDELSRGLVEMVRTMEIPMWLVLGCQIYLDIHHTMLSKMSMAHQKLQALGLHVSSTLQAYTDFSKGMSIENWPKENDTILQMIKLEVDLWVNKDTLATAKKKVYISGDLPESDISPYSLLSRQPILCGLMLFRLNMRMQEAGTLLVNAWGSLPSVMHLYNAVKQESPKDSFRPWQDIEAIIQIQGEDRVFGGSHPLNVDDYFKRFCLVMGCSASMFSPNGRQGRSTPQTHTSDPDPSPRTMTATSAITDTFRGQYCNNADQFEATFYKIETLLEKSTAWGEGSRTNTNNAFSKVTVSSFLSDLQDRIQQEFLALNIDYFALHALCIHLLRSINVQLHGDFQKHFGPHYLEKESQLPFLVGYLFGIAASSRRAAEILNIAGPTDVVKSAILAKAGYIVTLHVQTADCGPLALGEVKTASCHKADKVFFVDRSRRDRSRSGI